MIKKKNNGYGGFILTFEPVRYETVDAALRFHREEATETFSSKDWKFQDRELVLICGNTDEIFEDERILTGAALMERSRVGGATGKLKMRIHTPVMFEEPIRIGEIPTSLRRRLTFSTSLDLNRLSNDDWTELLTAIERLRPKHAAVLSELSRSRLEERRIFPRNTRLTRLTEQRDAIGVTLDIAGLDRRKILGKLDLSTIDSARSALDLLDSQPIHEQDVLRHDFMAFGTLLRNGMRHAQFASATGMEVRIHIYDKKPLETLLGIDLLIYLETFESYLLIQYKMMQDGAGPDMRCSVDPQLIKQIGAMERIVRAIGSNVQSPAPIRDWRLNDDMFFWKFCEPTRPSDTEGSLAHGITLTYRHLADFLQLQESQGPFGGQAIGYANCSRYLTNSQFIDLAQAGWIGGGKQARGFMEQILAANQTRNRQTILAVVEDREKDRHVKRDWRTRS